MCLFAQNNGRLQHQTFDLFRVKVFLEFSECYKLHPHILYHKSFQDISFGWYLVVVAVWVIDVCITFSSEVDVKQSTFLERQRLMCVSCIQRLLIYHSFPILSKCVTSFSLDPTIKFTIFSKVAVVSVFSIQGLHGAALN